MVKKWPQQTPEPEPGSEDAARLAYREIRAILRRRGVCGFALFQSHERAYVIRHLPDWQAIIEHKDEKGEGLRVRLKRAEEPDQETYDAKASRTASVIDAMFQVLAAEALAYGNLQKMIEQAWDVDWAPLGKHDPEVDH